MAEIETGFDPKLANAVGDAIASMQLRNWLRMPERPNQTSFAKLNGLSAAYTPAAYERIVKADKELVLHMLEIRNEHVQRIGTAVAGKA